MPWKFQLDQIQNGRPAVTFHLNIHNNWETLPAGGTITIELNVPFQVGIYRVKCQLDQIQDSQHGAIIKFKMGNIWKTVPVS